jgi:hypothetical protein
MSTEWVADQRLAVKHANFVGRRGTEPLIKVWPDTNSKCFVSELESNYGLRVLQSWVGGLGYALLCLLAIRECA